MHILSVGFHETNIIFIWHHSINRSIYKKNVGRSRFPSRLVIRTNLPFPSLYFTKCFIFYVWYVYQFFFYCSDSSYLLWRGRMYFLSCTSIVWNRGYHSIFVCYCVMIDVEQRTGHFDNNLTGTENDLNHVLSTFVDSEHEITNFCHSQYVDMSEIHSIFQNSPKEFLILTLNIQSVHAKFNNLFPVIDNLASQGLYFGAICLQETWTSSDSDLSLLQLELQLAMF